MLALLSSVLIAVSSLGGTPSWHDEFRGPQGAAPNPTHWWLETGTHGWNGELENYQSENAQLDGRGHLVITAKADYTSARLESRDRFEFRYGNVAARIKIPRGQGLWPSFWLLGANVDSVGWPASGEIDVMEVLGHDLRTLYASTHSSLGSEHYRLDASLSGWHVYRAKWTQNGITFLLDGVPYARSTAQFSNPMFLVLNLAVGGTWPGVPDATTPFPSQMLVDWVRVAHYA